MLGKVIGGASRGSGAELKENDRDAASDERVNFVMELAAD
jgi:hypothetical protein